MSIAGNSKYNVVILGASNKPERYSHMALERLVQNGYSVIPVHPALNEIEGIKVANNLADIKVPVHTLTLYISPAHVEPLIDKIVALKPGKVIFNPHTESEPLKKALEKAKIDYIEACTLVLLGSGQFQYMEE